MSDETKIIPDAPDPGYIIKVCDNEKERCADINVYFDGSNPRAARNLVEAAGGVIFQVASTLVNAGVACHSGCAILGIVEELMAHLVHHHPEVAAEYRRAAVAAMTEGTGFARVVMPSSDTKH